MKKWLIYIALGIGGILIWGFAGGIGKMVGRTAVEKYQQGKIEGTIEKAQELAAKHLRKQLPLKVDEITTMQNVVSVGKNLTYFYTMDRKKSDPSLSQFIRKMTPNIIKNVCGQKDMALSIKYGGSFTYSYMGSDGLSIGSIKISKKECGIN
jgi:hypothetical protein